jgi:hypothetical protein
VSKPTEEISALGIVLVGDFNPKIFQPAWLASESLIRKQEAESADMKVLVADLSVFEIPPWLRIQVTNEQFLAATTQEAFFEPLYDLVIGIFKLLHHTPIKMMGINREMHYRMASADEWHKFGHALAPKETWKKCMESPGMAELTIRGLRKDSLTGHVNTTVAPSPRIIPGVFIKVNDHFEASKGGLGAVEILEILESSFNTSLKQARFIADTLLNAN